VTPIGPAAAADPDRAQERGIRMIRLVRSFLAAEAVGFGAASLVHAGVLAHGWEHWKAATAEGVIALVLLGGLLGTVAAPAAGRTIGLAAQAFALLGTFVGLFTIAIGVGPRTLLDMLLHIGFVGGLTSGLFVVARRGRLIEPSGPRARLIPSSVPSVANRRAPDR
jgi:hypothetical protein